MKSLLAVAVGVVGLGILLVAALALAFTILAAFV